jgi:hypothetical protein
MLTREQALAAADALMKPALANKQQLTTRVVAFKKAGRGSGWPVVGAVAGLGVGLAATLVFSAPPLFVAIAAIVGSVSGRTHARIEYAYAPLKRQGPVAGALFCSASGSPLSRG